MRFRPVRIRVDDDWILKLVSVCLVVVAVVWECADEFYEITCCGICLLSFITLDLIYEFI